MYTLINDFHDSFRLIRDVVVPLDQVHPFHLSYLDQLRMRNPNTMMLFFAVALLIVGMEKDVRLA